MSNGKEKQGSEFLSAKYVICRALLVRADFAIQAKLSLRSKMKVALKNGDEEKIRELQNDREYVDSEVDNTYHVLECFRSIFSPRLDASLEGLQYARDKVQIPSSIIQRYDEDSVTVTTDDGNEDNY